MWGNLVGAALLVAPPAPPASGDASADVVAVAPLETSGALPEKWTQALRTAVDQGLERGRFETRGLDGTCSDPSCWASRGAQVQADFVVVVSVAVTQKVYTIRADLVRVSDAAVIAQAEDTCEVCGLANVEDRTVALAATIRDKVDASMDIAPRLLVQTNPAGARVLLDGALVGTSPVELDGTPGQHRLRVELDGHVPLERDLALVRGVDESVDLDLSPLSSPGGSGGRSSPDRVDRTRSLVTAGWATLGVGLAGAATGAALWIINDDPVRSRCSGTDQDEFGSCRYLYDTLTGGIALVATGAALTITGAALLGVGYQRRARVAFGPKSLWVEVRF